MRISKRTLDFMDLVGFHVLKIQIIQLNPTKSKSLFADAITEVIRCKLLVWVLMGSVFSTRYDSGRGF